MTVARRATFAVGDTFANFTGAFHAWLTACGMMRNGNSADAYVFNSPGGVRRFAVLVNATKPGVGGNFRVLDTSVDWRERLLRVAFLSVDGTPAVSLFPGANVEDKRFALSAGTGGAAHQLYWTGVGVTLPQAAATGRSMRPTTANGGLVVRSSDGALCWEKFSADTLSPQCVAVLVEGSERMSAGFLPALAVPAGVDAVPITPPELNELQDAGVLSQMRGNTPMAGVIAPVPKESETFPCGPVVYGDPPVPVRAQRLYKNGSENPYTYEARQTVGATGILRRWVKTGALAPNAWTVVDASADWRDRMIVVMTRSTTVNNAPGFIVSAFTFGAFTAGCYTGLGVDPSVPPVNPGWRARVSPGVAPDITVFARESDGNLVVKNEGINTYYVLGFVEGSFPIGPRSTRRPT